jgi:mannose-6-phosphate isomerase-like protein (cupin superfamily)
MRVHFLAATFLVAINASSALAQVVGESGPNVRTFTSSNDVLGLIAKLKTNRKDGQPLAFEPILQLAPYSATLEYRVAMAPAAVHETDAELMYVIDGSGTIVTGGKLTDPKRVNAANLSGANIEGGTSQTVNKGDFLIVPQNTPHQITPSGGAIILMTVKMPRTAAAH